MDKCPSVEISIQEKLRKTCPVIVLASQSPNRRKVLENAGIQVIIRPQNIWEICGETEPSKVVTALSFQKMDSYLKSQEFDSSLPAVAIDTLVYLDGKLMGKPKDDEDARSMLRSFSGKWHEVYSGMSVYVPQTKKTEVVCVVTRVLFHKLSESDIDWYVSTGDPKGAAGAYKIQENGFKLIDAIDGSFSNIIGIPLERLIDVLS